MSDICYLDNAATTSVSPAAAKAAFTAMTVDYGNPSSVHSMGITAENIVKGSRASVASALGCNPSEIFFTSGGTEADNWALIRGAELMKHRGKHLITTAIEHDAILNTSKYLETIGFEVTYLPPDKDGNISLHAVEAAIRKDTVMLSMMLVNNETGVLLPVSAAATILKRHNPYAIVHSDAVQAFLKFRFNPRSIGADMVSVSSHKIHGPKGAGALYIRNGLRIKPLLFGGGQENSMRSGTEAVPAIAGFGAAAAEGFAKLDENTKKISSLRYMLIEGLKSLPGIVLIAANGSIATISYPKYPSEVLIRMLESRGIFVSGGSACSRGRASHVLSAMNVDRKLINSAVRISLSYTNSKEDIIRLLSALKEI